MKYALPIIAAGFLLVNCGSKTEPDMIEQGVMMNSSLTDTCFCDSLTMNDNGVYLFDDKEFTGVCIHNYPGTETQYMVKSMLKGKLHGSVTYFDKMGEILMEEVYENGEKKRTGSGAPLTCDCAELEQFDAPGEPYPRFLLDGIPFNGKCIDKYADIDQTYMERNYKEGLLDGFSIYYDRFGNTMYMDKYEQGAHIKTIHE